MRPITWSVLVVVLVLSSFAAFAAADPFAPLETTTPGGMRALFLPRAGSGTVLVAVTVAAGGEMEPADRAGLSHFLEHLLFDGVPGLDERGITEFFETHSGYANAFTRGQTTVFFVLAPKGEAAACADLLARMLTKSTLTKDAVEKERKVILEELARDAQRPDAKNDDALREALWKGTPLGHPAGGTPAGASAATHDEIVAYWRAHYVPRGMRLIVIGDAPVPELQNVAAPFAALKSTAPAPPTPKAIDAGWGDVRTVAGDTTQPVLEVVLELSAEARVSEATNDLLAKWLGREDGPVARALVPSVARSVSVQRVPRFQAPDLLDIRVDALPSAERDTVLAKLLAALSSAGTGPEDQDARELGNAASAERILEGQRLHYLVMLHGEELAATRGPLVHVLQSAPVTPTELGAAAMAWFGARPESGGRVVRARAGWTGSGPTDAKPIAWPSAPKAAAPASTTKPGPSGSRVTTLANGLTLAVLEEPNAPAFGFYVLVADRALREPAAQPGLADLAQRLLGAATTLSPGEAFGRRLRRAGLELKTADEPMIPYDDEDNVPEYAYVRVEGPASSLPFAIEQLAEAFKQPAWDKGPWERALAANRQERRAQSTGSNAAAYALRAKLFGATHPWARPVVPAGDAKFTEVDVRALLGAWPSGWLDPASLIVAVVGPASADEVALRFADVLGDGPAAKPKRGPYPAPTASSSTAPSPAAAPPAMPGGPPQVSLTWGRAVVVEPADRAALLVALGALSDRMVAVIREKEGLAYRVGAGARGLPDGTWLISAGVGTRPDNRARVEQLFGEIAQRLATEEIAAADLARLVGRARQRDMLARLSAASRAGRIARQLFEGDGSPLGVGDDAQRAVTPAQVKAAAAKYLASGLTLATIP